MRTLLVTIGTIAVLITATPVAAQMHLPPRADVVELAGPRIGLTSMTPDLVDRLAERDIAVTSVITQFGWQLEKQFRFGRSGITPVTELVVLVGGLEQDVAIPSVSMIVGLRTPSGAEFGVGPNITPAGTSLVVAAGVTMKLGYVNVPMNFAIVPSAHGLRLTVLTGFSVRKR